MNYKMLCSLIFSAALLSAPGSEAYVGQAGATQIAGGSGGSPFADTLPAGATRIAEVRVRAGDQIDAVQVIYALSDGRLSEGVQHGGRGGRQYSFTLESDEYITGISGRYGNTIDSLRIHTNKRTSPTFGGTGGNNDFRIDVPSNSQATGLVGRSGNTVDAIGLSSAQRVRQDYLSRRRRPSQDSSTTIAGGSSGSSFADTQPANGARIAEVRVRAGNQIDAVQIVYALSDGRLTEAPRHGGSGGHQYVFTLESDEYITGISGRYGNTIDSLRIHTNKRTSPTFGGTGGSNDFRIDVPSDSQATGLVGRSENTVNALGLSSTQPFRQDYPSRRRRQSQGSSTTIAGGSGGSPFTDTQPGQGTRIAEVRIRAGDQIDAVQVIYAFSDGRTSEGLRHGGSGGHQYTFTLESDEYITGISGRYGNTIDSLHIHTNKRTSPLYGGRGGNQDFTVEVPSGEQATGFIGRAGNTLDAVGLAY
jgi:hypothetical protein